jgi:hypothetical protein
VANLTAPSAGPYDGILFSMNYPFCGIYVYLSYFVDMFHLVSVLLTTCLGVQKVVAIQFPFWTRNHLTKKKYVKKITQLNKTDINDKHAPISNVRNKDSLLPSPNKANGQHISLGDVNLLELFIFPITFK